MPAVPAQPGVLAEQSGRRRAVPARNARAVVRPGPVMAMPEPVDPVVAARIADWLTAWHRDADPGEDTPYATVSILDSAGEAAGEAVLTRRQADELAAWQAGVASTTSAPWAMAGELRRR